MHTNFIQIAFPKINGNTSFMGYILKPDTTKTPEEATDETESQQWRLFRDICSNNELFTAVQDRKTEIMYKILSKYRSIEGPVAYATSYSIEIEEDGVALAVLDWIRLVPDVEIPTNKKIPPNPADKIKTCGRRCSHNNNLSCIYLTRASDGVCAYHRYCDEINLDKSTLAANIFDAKIGSGRIPLNILLRKPDDRDDSECCKVGYDPVQNGDKTLKCVLKPHSCTFKEKCYARDIYDLEHTDSAGELVGCTGNDCIFMTRSLTGQCPIHRYGFVQEKN